MAVEDSRKYVFPGEEGRAGEKTNVEGKRGQGIESYLLKLLCCRAEQAVLLGYMYVVVAERGSALAGGYRCMMHILGIVSSIDQRESAKIQEIGERCELPTTVIILLVVWSGLWQN